MDLLRSRGYDRDRANAHELAQHQYSRRNFGVFLTTSNQLTRQLTPLDGSTAEDRLTDLPVGDRRDIPRHANCAAKFWANDTRPTSREAISVKLQ
ncbi:hypothetical protein pipiens_003334 [Culex pipiens pipiens]|uniref:Uncharacterized protein n=1 Tax=Culex pipiens pipiens TaxID=38569 RepID=A0ABD1D155_CULPP